MDPMQTQHNLWSLMSPSPGGLNSWLQKATGQCREHQCEACIATLVEAVPAEPHNCAIHFQLGICCGGTCRVHLQTSPEIALTYLRLALTLVNPSEQMKERAQILSAMGNTWLISGQESHAVRLQAAISCFKDAARTYLGFGNLEAWAREEYNLGNSYCELPEETTPGKWEEAISHYQSALQIRTKERDRIRFAATQENLGTAYRGLSAGDKAVNVRRAIICYRQALRVFTPSEFPTQNAALHNNLGNAYASFPSGDFAERGKNMRRALRHFDRALRIRNRVSFPCDYAVTQFNRGGTFLRLALDAPHPQQYLRSAQFCFREAGSGFAQAGQVARTRAAQEQAEQVRACLEPAGRGEGHENSDRFRHSR